MLFNYPEGVGQDIDCAPDSAGKSRNPAGRDTAWGRRGWKCRNKIEKDVKRRGEYCADVGTYLYFFKIHIRNVMRLQTCRWEKKLKHSSMCISLTCTSGVLFNSSYLRHLPPILV